MEAFSHQDATRSPDLSKCASWEKGSVENCNRRVRRWYPKDTDFSRVSVQTIAALEDRINAIHRRSLDASTALQCFLQESA